MISTHLGLRFNPSKIRSFMNYLALAKIHIEEKREARDNLHKQIKKVKQLSTRKVKTKKEVDKEFARRNTHQGSKYGG